MVMVVIVLMVTMVIKLWDITWGYLGYNWEQKTVYPPPVKHGT